MRPAGLGRRAALCCVPAHVGARPGEPGALLRSVRLVSQVLLKEALQGVNIVRHNHKWWLVGSAAGGDGHGAPRRCCCRPAAAAAARGRRSTAAALASGGTRRPAAAVAPACPGAGHPPRRGPGARPHPPRPPRGPLAAARPAGGQDHTLRLLKSKSPLGPWEPHLGGRLAAENGLTMGPIFKWKNSLHRLGRACRGGECGRVEVNQARAGRRGLRGCRLAAHGMPIHHVGAGRSGLVAQRACLVALCCCPSASRSSPCAVHAAADVHFRGGI